MSLFNKHHFWLWFPLVSFIGLMVVVPLFATHDPIHAETGREIEAPSTEHWLGTDRLGRDEWSRLVIGGRRTLTSALLSTSIATLCGLFISGLTIVSPRLLRWVISAFTDALLAFPPLLLALMVRTILEGSLLTVAIAVGIAGIAPYSLVGRDALQIALSQPYIEGAYSIGASRWRIITRHLMPAAAPSLAAFTAITFAWSLLYGAALAFLGLSGDPSQPDWGMMTDQATQTLIQAPHLLFFPGGMLALSVWLAHRLADEISRPNW
jgi:peptide/nickel transport system permease protein